MSLMKPARRTDEAPNVEGEIRDFIRRDISAVRSPSDLARESAAEKINSAIGRVTGNSISEIDNLIAELQSVRGFLAGEGERVQRELTSYAEVNQMASSTVKVISESISQWKTTMGGRSTNP